MKFLIHETELVEVTFVKEVEADDETDALNKNIEGDTKLLGVSLGDVSPMSIAKTEILPHATFNIPAYFYKEPE